MDQESYEKACEELQNVDPRIPQEVVSRAVKLFFSTNILPDFDLSTCYTIELPSTNMIALIMPLPDTSHFQMPPPFGKQRNYTWALIHGTSLSSSQQILLEGKIRPANWSYHKNPQRCELPTFGAFFLGRQVSNNDTTIPPWAERDLLDSAGKKVKGTAGDHRRGDVPGCLRAHGIQSWWPMKWLSSVWLTKESSPHRKNIPSPTATTWV